jgi:hypothetical protein
MACAEAWKDAEGRLEEDEIEALDYVFGGLEAAVGVRSSYGSQIDRAMGLKMGGKKGGHVHENLQPVEYWACWTVDGRRRAGLVAYRALRLMLDPRWRPGPLGIDGDLLVRALYAFYGPRPPGPDFESIPELGPLGRLVALTPTAERIASDARAQSIAGAVAEVMFASARADKGEIARVEKLRRPIARRIAREADEVLSFAVHVYRQAFAAKWQEARKR